MKIFGTIRSAVCILTSLYLIPLHCNNNSLSVCSSQNKDSEVEVSGNVNTYYTAREYGKVKAEEAQNIPRPYYLGNKSMNFSFFASYTLWSPYQEGMNLAISNIPPAPVANLPAGNIIRPNTGPRSGFKAGVEKYLHFDDWKASVQYTWFYNVNEFSNRLYNIDFVYQSPWILAPHTDVLDFPSSFSNQFNRIDAVLKRDLAITTTFIFTPWIGLVGAWEDQHLNANTEVQPPAAGDLYFFYMNNSQYWWCVGPYSGAEIIYRFINHISLYLRGGGSINLAKHDIYQDQETAEAATPDERTTIQNIDDHRWNTEPMLETSLGLGFDYEWEKFACFLKAGWELQTWFEHNGFLPARNMNTLAGSYSMQGLTASFGIVF